MKRLLSRPGRIACAVGLTVILGALLFTSAFDADSGIEPVFDQGMY